MCSFDFIHLPSLESAWDMAEGAIVGCVEGDCGAQWKTTMDLGEGKGDMVPQRRGGSGGSRVPNRNVSSTWWAWPLTRQGESVLETPCGKLSVSGRGCLCASQQVAAVNVSP